MLIGDYDNLVASYFGINKTERLIAQKYYWLSLKHNIKIFAKACKNRLVCKFVYSKPYRDI